MKKIYVLILATAMTSIFACSSAPREKPAPSPQVQPTPMKAEPRQASNAMQSMSCQKDTDTRTVEIQAKDAGCAVMYTKFGKTISVASSSAGNAHCVKTLAHMKQKLEASGFQCK